MPNWFYLLINTLYHLGLALWLGGAIALGALTAPALFRALPRPQAGAIFGQILRRFAKLRVLALVLSVVGAGTKYLVWESHATSTASWIWIALRWLALAFMAFTVVYEMRFLVPDMERKQAEMAAAADDDPRRQAFNVLHRRAEGLMRASLVASLVALVLS